MVAPAVGRHSTEGYRVLPRKTPCSLVLLSLVAGCGEGTGQSHLDSAPASDSIAATGGSSGDAVNPLGAGTHGSDPDEATVSVGELVTGATKHGTVILSQVDVENLPATPSFVAAFQESEVTWQGCTRYEVAECYFYECPEGANSVHSIIDTALPAASAGTISATFETSSYSLEMGASGLYQATDIQRLWGQAGVEVVVTGSGDDVPPFRLSVSAPAAVTLLSPVSVADTPLELASASHFPLAWTPGASGDVRVAIYDLEFKRARPALFCTYPAEWGTAVIPSAALMEMELGGPYVFRLAGTAETSTSAGDWTVVMSTMAFGTANDGVINGMLWLR